MRNDHGDPALLELLVCRRCRLVFVGTPVTEEQLAAAYATMDWQAYYAEIAASNASRVEAALSDVAPLLGFRGEEPSLLDAGCGYGHFLSAVARLYPEVRLRGHEFSLEEATAAQARGLHVYTGPLLAITERFSIITLLDVAEHVQDPVGIFRDCYELLEPGGHLYLRTPRRCLWDTAFMLLANVPPAARVARAWLRARLSIFHLQLWSDRALRTALERAGFAVQELRRERELAWPVDRYARVYLGEKLGVGPVGVRVVGRLADLLFKRIGVLRNKAVCIARKSVRARHAIS
jgi:2-polyprenyl-3-methyl-5-hydroxy-6-metoxy-1,4-benzoquinol methylase